MNFRKPYLTALQHVQVDMNGSTYESDLGVGGGGGDA